MISLYCNNLTGNTLLLGSEDSRHLKVLRLKAGENVLVTDGQGKRMIARISNPDSRGATLEIVGPDPDYLARKYFLHIAISPTTNPDRFEWFVEKSVELGIDRITPILCSRTEKTGVRIQRLQHIAIAALKQSGSAILPAIDEPIDFSRFISVADTRHKYIAHCVPGQKLNLLQCCPSAAGILILIGPEGDFSPDEIRLAQNQSFIPVSLGMQRLRTETAGLYVCQAVQMINLTL